jgi:hypothetical protein
MKRLLLIALLGAVATGVFAQSDSTKALQDTSAHKKSKYKVSFNWKSKHDTTATSTKKVSKAPGFTIGLTFARFDLGLATLVDNGSFTLSPKNDFLRYRSWKTSNVGFDVFQAGYRFNSAFKIYLSAGFDWTHIRLREDITIQRDPDMSGLKYTNDAVDYSKNRFSSSYLRLPLSFEFRTHDNSAGKRWHFVAGPDIGILLNGRVKQISDEFGKQKLNYTYHYTKLRYGGFARIGYGSMGIFAKYYMNDMFDTEAQKGLKNLSFGVMVGF